MINKEPGPSIKMSDVEFSKFSNFIYDQCGINLSIAKKVMLESRLQRRLSSKQLSSFKGYFELISGPNGLAELIEMINVVTTNKTDFFREPLHFDYLLNNILPVFKWKRNIRIWSAGCSTGEEPYTIAMILSEFNQKNGPLDYFLLGTDISTEVLKKAINAVYSMEKVLGVPKEYKTKYLLKSKDTANPTARIVPELRRKVVFEHLNFMDESYTRIPGFFDLIFCRNAIIYFDRKTQEEVINKLCKKLNKGGYLFLGHSESIADFNVPLEQVRPTIFRKL